MKAAALLLVLLAARLAALSGHTVWRSPWTPIAYCWQDAALVVAFASIELAARRRRTVITVMYAVATLYVAATIPVVRVLGTPLTVPMWRAAAGALGDSIRYYATPSHLGVIGALTAIAVVAPLATRRVRPRALVWLLPVVALGPFALAHVDTHGLDRNAWSALVLSAAPRAAAGDTSDIREPVDWRSPLVANAARGIDLSLLRGAAAGRSIVLVGLESTAAQYLGVYGASPDPAPNLSQLAGAAVVFDRAYAVYPESIKGLFATLCSRYPAFDRSVQSFASAPCRSPASVLADRGYHTALFHSGRFGYLGMDVVVGQRGYQTLADAGGVGGNRESSFGVDEPATVAAMLRWIDSLPSGAPFFLTYLPIAGHHPYESASDERPFSEGDELGRYRNAIHDGDAALGAFVRGLRERGLYDHTMFVVYGDHGEAFGQHPANYGHTFQLFEENVHVPFLIALPSSTLTGQLRSNQVISLLDTAPTLLDVAGIAAPPEYQGSTALAWSPRMALFFADYSLGVLGLRDGANKLTYELESGRARLFDLDRDPAELTDLASQRKATAEDYARHLKQWIRTGPGG